MSPRRYTRLVGAEREQAKAVAAEVYRAGASIDEVAAELARRGVEVSRSTVRTLLIEAGVDRRSNFGDPERMCRAANARWGQRDEDKENGLSEEGSS